jgi:hypothetical protein
MKTDYDIRAELQRALGFPLPEETWQFLLQRSYISEIEQGENTIPGVAAEVRKFRRAFGQPVPEPDNATLMLDKKPNGREWSSLSERVHAISVLLAYDAEEDPLVVTFRKSVLNDQLLEPEEVEEWVKRQATTDGKPTRLLNAVPLPPDTEYQWDRTAGGWVTDPPVVIDHEHPALGSASYRFLSYGVPEDGWQRAVPTTVGGVLEKLRQVSEHLAKRYGWQDAQATLCVLTGRIPVASAIRATEQLRLPLPVTTRITLVIDPTLTPRDVARHYSKVRQKVIGKRHRPLSEKHVRLAMFSAMRREEETWPERMAAWNKEHQDWRYTQVGNFQRDCLQAQRRLLHPEYQLALPTELNKTGA